MAAIADAITDLTERLKARPIYPIYQNCSEKDNITTLQFMYIVDFHANHYIKLYDRIKEIEQPKLLGQLLQFRQFEKFKYFHYPVNKLYGNYVLQCRYCELVGPCGCILTHMAINHNVHTSLKTCVFCKSATLETHLGNDSLGQCYSNYIEHNKIEVDMNMNGIVANFYEMFKKLCQNLNICSTRRKGYAGQGYRCRETLLQDYGGDIAQEYEVRYMIPKKQLNRSIRSESLDREFQRIMEISYGFRDYVSLLKKKHLPLPVDVIEIDDSSEDDDNEVNNITAENSAIDSADYCNGRNEQQCEFELQNAQNLPVDDMIPENSVKLESGFNDLLTPMSSSYANPMPSTSTPTERRNSRLSTFSSVSRTRQDWTPTNETEEFVMNIAKKLEKIPQAKRRQLEIDIEMKILQTEMEAIDEGFEQ